MFIWAVWFKRLCWGTFGIQPSRQCKSEDSFEFSLDTFLAYIFSLNSTKLFVYLCCEAYKPVLLGSFVCAFKVLFSLWILTVWWLCVVNLYDFIFLGVCWILECTDECFSSILWDFWLLFFKYFSASFNLSSFYRIPVCICWYI